MSETLRTLLEVSDGLELAYVVRTDGEARLEIVRTVAGKSQAIRLTPAEIHWATLALSDARELSLGKLTLEQAVRRRFDRIRRREFDARPATADQELADLGAALLAKLRERTS